MPYKHKDFEVRRQVCECYLPEPKDEVYAIVEELHDLVDDVIMPIRRELDGGWHHDPAIAEPAVEAACQALVDFGLLQAVLPEELGGPGGVLTSVVTYAHDDGGVRPCRRRPRQRRRRRRLVLLAGA